MKCKLCGKKYPEPDIVDEITYYVCSNCGNVLEIQKVDMQPAIKFERIWEDDSLVELEIKVNTADSIFSNTIYTTREELKELVELSNRFRNWQHNGLMDIDFGKFGYEIANGAFHARLHSPKPGSLYITTNQQSEYFEFKEQKVANEAKMFLKTTVEYFDEFLAQFDKFSKGTISEVKLICT